MNILWLPNFCPFPVDCGGKISISHRMEYVSQKHNVYMITQSEAIDEKSKNILNNICSDYVLVKPVNKSKKQYVKWLLTGSVNVGRYNNSEVTEKIKEYIKKYDIELINIDLPMVAIALEPLWHILRNIKIVINQHNIEFDCVRSKVRTKGVNPLMKLYALIESKRLYIWEKNLYSNHNIIAHIFVTKEDIALFQKAFTPRQNVKLIYSPIGTDVPDSGDNDKLGFSIEGKNIVFSAAFNYQPNIHGALWFINSVFPSIQEKVDSVRLILVGREPDRRIKSLACDEIIVTGTVQSVKPYLGIADLFIIPLFFGGGVKTKLIEAGAYGKPTVSTTSGAHGTVYKNIEDIMITDDAEEFARYCIDILNNPIKYKIMAENFKNITYKNYLWDSIGEQYTNYLEKIMS